MNEDVENLIKAVKKIVVHADENGVNVGVYKHLDMGTLIEFEDWQAINEAMMPFK